jgi:hypothetical protein
VRAGSRVPGHALLVGLIGLPVNVAPMMLLDQHLPLLARQLPDPLAPNAGRLERHLRSRLAIDVGARIDGVAQDLVDGMVARLDPANLRVRVHLQWEKRQVQLHGCSPRVAPTRAFGSGERR